MYSLIALFWRRRTQHHSVKYTVWYNSIILHEHKLPFPTVQILDLVKFEAHMLIKSLLQGIKGCFGGNVKKGMKMCDSWSYVRCFHNCNLFTAPIILLFITGALTQQCHYITSHPAAQTGRGRWFNKLLGLSRGDSPRPLGPGGFSARTPLKCFLVGQNSIRFSICTYTRSVPANSRRR